MKKAAILLMMSSTAFAAQPVKQTAVTTQTSRLVSQSMTPEEQTPAPKKTAKKKAAPQAVAPQQVNGVAQRTQLHPTVNAASPQYANALAKRSPKQSLTTNAPTDPGIQAPKFGDWELKAQIRNTLTMATAEELQNVGGKNFDLGNEVRIGLKHASGWGFSLTGAYQTGNFADPAGDTGVAKDASLMIFHPSLIKNDTFDFHGLVRIYAPTSEKSRENNIQSMAYWGFLDITLAKRFSMTNLLIARGNSQPSPAADDTQSWFYDSLELYHQTAKGISLSFGGQVIQNNSYASGSGTEVDLYPFIDFTIIPNVLIEPKYYFPVFVGGNGSAGVSGAALNQSQAELFIKIAI